MRTSARSSRRGRVLPLQLLQLRIMTAEELSKDADVVLADKGAEIGETDVIEVGRGLANYNSAQIMAV